MGVGQPLCRVTARMCQLKYMYLCEPDGPERNLGVFRICNELLHLSSLAHGEKKCG